MSYSQLVGDCRVALGPIPRKNTEDFEEKYEFARPLNTKKLEQEEVTFLIVESAVGGGFISVGRSLGKTRRVGKVAEKLDVL